MVVPLLHGELNSITKGVSLKLITAGKSMAVKADIGKPYKKTHELKISHILL